MTTRNRVAGIAFFISCMFATQTFAANKIDLKVGDPAPDLLGRDLDGEEIRLADYVGNVVVVSFFASWCEPCRKELPVLESLQRVGTGKGLHVIAVNWGEEARVLRQLVKQNPDYRMKFVTDPRGRTGKQYGVKAIPHMFLIGKDGKIAFVNIGYGESIVDRLVPEVNRALSQEEEQLPVVPTS